MPAAWYCRQSQSENGDERRSCDQIVRSQKTCAAWTGFDSSSRIENTARVTRMNAIRKRSCGRRFLQSGYDSQSGATTAAANFVHTASEHAAPRAHGDVTSQKP